MAFLVATTSLPAVDRPNADRWNAARFCQNWKIMTFIVATNVVASQPPEHRRTGTPHAHAKIMAFLVATTSLPAIYRPNGYARTTTAGTPHAHTNLKVWCGIKCQKYNSVWCSNSMYDIVILCDYLYDVILLCDAVILCVTAISNVMMYFCVILKFCVMI